MIPGADAKYGVIVADPPWKFRNFKERKHGAAASAMVMMTPEEIAAVPIVRWAADDCVLLLWCTWPQLDVGIDVLRAWGFDYVTGFPWVKTTGSGEPRVGIGRWTQSVSEMVLIARLGGPKLDDDRPRVNGLLVGEEAQFYAPISSHSVKPLGLAEWAEALWPDAAKLELFACRERPGWISWGLDLGQRLSCRGVEPADAIVPPDVRFAMTPAQAIDAARDAGFSDVGAVILGAAATPEGQALAGMNLNTGRTPALPLPSAASAAADFD